ncbi:MAG: efflux RND transporter periplasmic adaptor subunit [Anaerolineales bacterium]|nr:efflux RND transporter periplasmic adaptor subunit [Anaerolineales bacterium]
MTQQDRKAGKFNKNWILAVLAAVMLAGIGIYQLVQPEQDPDSGISQTTSTIRRGDIRLSAIGSGTLIPAVEIKLAFENRGVVEEILVEVGDEVSEGQILVVLDDEDLQETLDLVEGNLRELISDAAVSSAALELAEAQKAVLSAESELKFLISPYVYKAEIRLREAELELQSAIHNSSDEAESKVIEAEHAVEEAAISLDLNWQIYAEEYVPDTFNFPWRDRFGFKHNYYDPPSETEVAVVRAELAASEARVEEAESYLAALSKDVIPENASGTQLTALEKAREAVIDAQEKLEASRLAAPFAGMVLKLNLQVLDTVNANPVLTIVQLEPITIEVSFDEGDWQLVKEGNPVEVIFDSLPEKSYSGQIVFVDPSLQTAKTVTTVNALVELDISTTGWANLPLGSAASVEVIAGEVKNAVLLPVEALEEQQGSEGIVLLLENNEVTRQSVELGLRDVIYVEVTGGLSAGDVVVIGNLEY